MRKDLINSVLIWLVAFAGTALAQQGTSEIRGRVVDAQAAGVPGVTVTVRNQDTGVFRETISNPDGTYFVSGVVPGFYEVTGELQGFKKAQQRDVRLEVGKTASLDLTLQLGSLE